MKKILAFILAVLLVFGMAGCKSEEDAGRSVVAETEHFQVDAAMMSYFIYTEYTVFLNQYADMLTHTGLDTTKPLKDQLCGFSDGKTWLEFFNDAAMEQVRVYLYLAEKAQAAGMELSESDRQGIQVVFDEFYKAAKKEGYENAAYLEMTFGAGITEADVRRCLELSALAHRYEESYRGSINVSVEEAEAFYQANQYDYLYTDYYAYDVIDDTAAAAKARAEKIAAAKTAEEFQKKVEQDLNAHSSEMSEAEREKLLSSIDIRGNFYYEKQTYSKWLFTQAKVGETLITEKGKSGYSVYLCTRLPYRQEEITRNVRYIPLMAATYGSNEAAMKQAASLLMQLHQQGLTDAAFEEVAAKYSEHESAAQGGLMLNASSEDFMEPIAKWFFSEKRVEGQCEVVPFDDAYGYAICCYLNEGLPKWQADCTAALKEQRYQQSLKEWSESVSLTEHEWDLNSVPELKQK